MKTTTKAIRALKGKQPIVCVTAYDASMATFADRAGCDLILVGDSVGNTQLGYASTVPVTLDQMVHHGAAVCRAHPQALVVVDLPFAWAARSPDALLAACMRLVQETGADAIKLEGGADYAAKVALLCEAGIPVMGHIGLLPQRVQQLGGYRSFGRNSAEADRLVADGQAIADAGAFAIVLEMVTPEVAARVTEALPVPTIGIGSGPATDGQILVCNDLLGLSTGPVPSFVRRYADIGNAVEQAFRDYASDVRQRRFPEAPAGKNT